MAERSEAPAPVARPGFIVVSTPDVERMTHYYVDALGLRLSEQSDGTSYLTTGVDHHCVVVQPGRPDGRAAIGFVTDRDLGDVQSALRAAGIESELQHDPQPGLESALVLREPGTGTPLHLYREQSDHGGPATLGVRPSKLGHIASYVEDLEAAQSYYEDVLGFRWSDTIGDFFTFLRCNTDHHAINLMRSSAKHGLFHVAFEMRDVVHLKDALDHLAARQIRLQWGPGRHGAGHNIFTYHHDPDGNLVELFTEIDRIADDATGRFEPRPWHESWPQGPQFWGVDVEAANKWGPVDPEMLVH